LGGWGITNGAHYTLRLTCGRGRQLFHVDGVMDIVVLEYVGLPCLEVTL